MSSWGGRVENGDDDVEVPGWRKTCVAEHSRRLCSRRGKRVQRMKNSNDLLLSPSLNNGALHRTSQKIFVEGKKGRNKSTMVEPTQVVERDTVDRLYRLDEPIRCITSIRRQQNMVLHGRVIPYLEAAELYQGGREACVWFRKLFGELPPPEHIDKFTVSYSWFQERFRVLPDNATDDTVVIYALRSAGQL
ncbi:hypothetical protein PIB30_016362 [Stylosanthes scabra]|uniref:Uncharacterized protein n=1 Tax=Stylosanthes scabra TaxID=79078 RepID=A0ABU6T860_9FABA|nr:hypothetical protein [Stylosanthes scabra]